MLPTHIPDNPQGSPKRPPSVTKTIRSQVSHTSAEDLSTGRNRYTSVLYSSLPQVMSSSAATATRPARLALPAMAARISAAPHSPPTTRDSFILSSVLEDLTESEIPELATLPSPPTWAPAGVSPLRFLKTSSVSIRQTHSLRPPKDTKCSVLVCDVQISAYSICFRLHMQS
jgi:hypothetical protein